MTFDLNAVNPRLVEIWERTCKEWPNKIQPDIRPLKEIESDCGEYLPEDYKDFVRSYGYIDLELGEFNACIVKYSVGQSIKRNWAWALDVSTSSFALNRYMFLSRPHMHYSHIGPRIPPKTVPIGTSSGGDDYYLIDLSEEKYGRIWFNGGNAVATWGTEGNTILGFVAPSFTAFLAGLMTKDEAEQKLAAESP